MSVFLALLLTLRSWARSRAVHQLEVLALHHQLQAFPGWANTAQALGIEEVLEALRSP